MHSHDNKLWKVLGHGEGSTGSVACTVDLFLKLGGNCMAPHYIIFIPFCMANILQ